MNIVIIGATGLIGSRLAGTLRDHGHEAIPASRASGINILTGEGLADVLDGAEVVVDVSDSRTFEAEAARAFFETATTNLLAAEAVAGVRHHIALSAVGTDRLLTSGYFEAKLAQESLVRKSGIPYSLVHATQCFEFISRIADQATTGNTVRLAPVQCQPIAAEDVARVVARVAARMPVTGIVEIAGPGEFRLDELVREALVARNDPRVIVADPEAPYFGSLLSDRTLLPDDGAHLGEITFDEWQAQVDDLAGKPPRQSSMGIL
jgi:uncharacterized protein YbjT (DUF2867 family)